MSSSEAVSVGEVTEAEAIQLFRMGAKVRQTSEEISFHQCSKSVTACKLKLRSLMKTQPTGGMIISILLFVF